MSDPTATNSDAPRRVLLAGATGYIGRFVARELARRGHEVLAPVRPRPDRDLDALRSTLPGCTLRSAPVTDRDGLADALEGERIDAVISCIATRNGEPADAWRVEHEANGHLLAVARDAGARRFVLLSAICVQRPTLAFQHAKLAFEADLQTSDLGWSIVRPTAFFKSLAGQVERVRAGKPFLVFGDGRATACKPIGEADLARFLVECLHDPALQERILPVGGPGPAITPEEQGAMLCELAGQPVRLKHVSPRLFDAVLAVLGPLGRWIPALEGKAEFARIGRYYATESMLLWDEARGGYDADATPSYGTETLRDFYARVLSEGMAGQELGEHKLF